MWYIYIIFKTIVILNITLYEAIEIYLYAEYAFIYFMLDHLKNMLENLHMQVYTSLATTRVHIGTKHEPCLEFNHKRHLFFMERS